MRYLKLSCLLFFYQYLDANRKVIKNEPPEETYRRLFVAPYITSLQEGDTASAKRALNRRIDVSYIPPKCSITRKSITKLLDEEKLTEEVYTNTRFETVDEAKEAYKSNIVSIMDKEARYKNIQDEIKRKEDHEASLSKSIFDVMQYYLPSVANMADPMVGSRSIEELREELADIEYEINKRNIFIDEHQRYFLKKQYYIKDPFGLQRSMETLQARNGVALEGDGQTIFIIDEFQGVMPERIIRKCANYEEIREKAATKEGISHGAKVASVAIDSEYGLAKNAMFRAEFIENMLLPKGEPADIDTTSEKNIVDCSEDFLKPHHLQQIDKILKDSETGFYIKDQMGKFRLIDASKIRIPNESVINMSFQYSDSLENRQLRKTRWDIYNLVSFVTIILKYAQAGKVIVWSAGNESIFISESLAYPMVRVLSEYKPECFISVPALDRDLVSMSTFTNQPGKHPLQLCSLSAPGTGIRIFRVEESEFTESGTSLSAPFVAGAIALMMSNFPKASACEVRDALIFSAAPVVMKRSESRFGEFPLIIRGTRYIDLVPGKNYTYFGKEGNQKTIFVTSEMIDRGRAKYGVGIIDISTAVDYLFEKYPNQIKMPS